MPKTPTAKQVAARKAFGDAAKARAAAKRESKETPFTATPIITDKTETQHEVDESKGPVNPRPDTISDEGDIQALLRRIQELEAAQWRKSTGESGGNGTSMEGGALTGTFEKYKVDPAYYPNPTERLKKEDKLQRFAFALNYDLDFTVSESAYTTIDKVRTKEPKFTLDLIKIVIDEETGDPTLGRYVVCRHIMHEDPDAALQTAREYGLSVENDDEKAFLDEMRYLRERDWLLECFYPAKVQARKNKKEVVIGNRLVEYFEVSGEESQSIPFAQLDAKKKL